jgi:hypothetical protein
LGFTIIREGIYNEIWQTFLMNLLPGPAGHEEEIWVPADGAAEFTALEDLAVGTALILSEDVAKWTGQTIVFSAAGNTTTLSEIAKTVGRSLKSVSAEEYVAFYSKERGVPEPLLRWGLGTFSGIRLGEAVHTDDTLINLLRREGKTLKQLSDTIAEMISPNYPGFVMSPVP